MKKIFAIILAVIMVSVFAACGEKTESPDTQQQNTTVTDTIETDTTENTVTPDPAPVQEDNTAEIKSADGTLTLSSKEIAVVVNGSTVAMPYRLGELEAAGVPADESRSNIELAAGDFFSANLYLDENEDYLLIPAYYNDKDTAIKITEADAEEITMTTYADIPEDQGVSILGISFGMPKSEVKALLGEPAYDDGSYLEWHVEIPDISYEGTLSMYLTDDADDAGVSQVDLTVFPK